MKPLFLFFTSAIALALSTASTANAAVLYDAALNSQLDQQGWMYLTDPLLNAQAQRSFTAAATRLDSTPNTSESAGFFAYYNIHPVVPVLDRQVGYTMEFAVKILEETHGRNDRAGFSVLVVGSDLRSIELGFWTDEIWAQSGPNHLDSAELLFTHAEGNTTVDPTQFALYELRVLGDEYSLWSGSTELLFGPLRDYSDHAHLVYSLPNTIFLGDNTSSAAALAEISYVAVHLGVIPEPSTAALLLVALVTGCLMRRRRTMVVQ